jgi:putative addiction module component (TIGR02574 family)
MQTTTRKVLDNAMSLSEKERELLALELWRSLDDTTQEQVWDAWAVEIDRRLHGLERGVAKSFPADEVMRQARRLVRKKRSA